MSAVANKNYIDAKQKRAKQAAKSGIEIYSEALGKSEGKKLFDRHVKLLQKQSIAG